jgi:hypothetical protein
VAQQFQAAAAASCGMSYKQTTLHTYVLVVYVLQANCLTYTSTGSPAPLEISGTCYLCVAMLQYVALHYVLHTAHSGA